MARKGMDWILDLLIHLGTTSNCSAIAGLHTLPITVDRDANNWILCQDSKIECQDIMEGLALSRMKEEATTGRLRAMAIGELTILRTFAPTDQKIRMMVLHLNLLAPYEGIAGDEWP